MYPVNLLKKTDVVAKYHQHRSGTNLPEGRPNHELSWIDALEKLILMFMHQIFLERNSKEPYNIKDEELDGVVYQINLIIQSLGLEIVAMLQPLQANMIYMNEHQHNHYKVSEDEALGMIDEFHTYVEDPGHGQEAGMLVRTAKLVDFVNNTRKVCDFLLEDTGLVDRGKSPRKILMMLQKNLGSYVKDKRKNTTAP